jgi:hypothetical protein
MQAAVETDLIDLMKQQQKDNTEHYNLIKIQHTNDIFNTHSSN